MPLPSEGDRRFYSWLALAFGPLFILGGLLSAMTDMGAVFIWTGLSMTLAGAGLRTRLPVALVIGVAIALLAALTACTAFFYPGRGL